MMIDTARHMADRQLCLMKVCALALASGMALAAPAGAAEKPAQLDLSAQVFTTVTNDEMRVVLAVDREGEDGLEGSSLETINAEVLQRLQVALALAKKVEGVRSKLLGISTSANWVDGKRQGWRVRGEIQLESKRFEALSELVGQLSAGLQLASVQFGLSTETQKKQSDALIARVSQAFRLKALATARSLGFRGYEIKAVQLIQDGDRGPVPMLQMARQATAAPTVPIEGGTSELKVTMSGSVSMLK